MSTNPNKLTYKGTPGPWKVNEFIFDNSIGIIAEEGNYNNFDRIVVHTVGKYDSGKKERNYANAHLISAAPEAVEFISDLMPIFELMNDRKIFNKKDIDKLIAGAEEILKKAYNF